MDEKSQSNPECENCRFYEAFDEKEGFCHRYAPRPHLVPEDYQGLGEIPFWPEVTRATWCGEWEEVNII